MRKILCILMVGCLWAQSAWAAEPDDGVRAIYATICEPWSAEESQSSARMRAADKASFKALENLSDLSDYRSKYDTHDYNVLIYALVDNYLEDVAVRTLKHEAAQVCVEVTGYLNTKSIELAEQEIAARHEAQYPDKLVVEETALTQPSPTEIPPKPEPKISDEIAVEQVLTEAQPAQPSTNAAAMDNLTKVFIERTQFYNNTGTNAFYSDIAQQIEDIPGLTITSSLSDADYIIKTKVLRAKVAPINKQTNRLQMVVALELINTADSSTLVEHQNRFMLFESTENEQNTAAALLKKLLRKAAKQIAPKIKPREAFSGAVITPPKRQA